MDAQQFWGASGIYTLATSQGVAYERPCSAEMFFPEGDRDENGTAQSPEMGTVHAAARSALPLRAPPDPAG